MDAAELGKFGVARAAKVPKNIGSDSNDILTSIFETSIPLSVIEPSRGFLEFGANSLILTSIAGIIKSKLSMNITAMTLLEFSNLNALREHLEGSKVACISIDAPQVPTPAGSMPSLGSM